MSIRALLQGVEATLRGLSWIDDPQGKVVGIQPLGVPPRSCGQTYIAVHWGGMSGDDANPQAVDSLHTVHLTLTWRMGFAPRDRRGLVVSSTDDLLDVIDRLAGPDCIHGAWAVVNAANDRIPGTARYIAIHGGSATTNGFCETLVFQNATSLAEAPPDWLGGEDAQALTCTLTFGLARRVQVLY